MTAKSLYESFTREVGGAYTLPWDELPSIARTAWEHAANTLVTENESLRADAEYARRQREEFARQNDELRAEVLRLQAPATNCGEKLMPLYVCGACGVQYRATPEYNTYAPCPNCKSTAPKTLK